MTQLVDVVNFNADASCLAASRWLDALTGGMDSEFCRWLRLYMTFKKPVVLGFTGATVVDIASWNPEAIQLIRNHPEIFALVLRPYAHDIALLRTEAGFRLNLNYGIRTLRREFGSYLPLYLPPEFMCNSIHVRILSTIGVEAVFINAGRFDSETASDIPAVPYRIRGSVGCVMECIPVHPPCTDAYLESIHRYDASPWNTCLNSERRGTVFCWRDGESIFLVPDSVRREHAWLSGESVHYHRILPDTADFRADDDVAPQPYPVHPFSAWTREMKMLWYLTDLRELERELGRLSPIRRHLWLHATNSDILSSAEKKSPVISLCTAPGSATTEKFTIRRQPRFCEGEEYLDMARSADETEISRYLGTTSEPHLQRLKKRLEYLVALDTKAE